MDCSGEDLSNPQNDNSVNFSGFDLTGIDFSEANLTNVNFEGAKLKDANFNRANLTNADLTGAKGITDETLAKAILCNTTWTDGKTKKSTDCKGADLSGQGGQDLTGQSFENVDLTGANLTGAKGITLEKLKSAKAILCRTKLPDGSQDDSGCPQKSG